MSFLYRGAQNGTEVQEVWWGGLIKVPVPNTNHLSAEGKLVEDSPDTVLRGLPRCATSILLPVRGKLFHVQWYRHEEKFFPKKDLLFTELTHSRNTLTFFLLSFLLPVLVLVYWWHCLILMCCAVLLLSNSSIPWARLEKMDRSNAQMWEKRRDEKREKKRKEGREKHTSLHFFQWLIFQTHTSYPGLHKLNN